MKTLFTFLIAMFFGATAFAQITLTNDSLLAYYSFDNNGENQFANRFHLSAVTNAGSAIPIYNAGKKGNAVRFNKNNALVNSGELANHLAASQNKSLSLSYWVNYASTNTSLSTFVELFENLFFRNSNLSFGMVGANNVWYSDHANGMLSGAGWRHIVAIYNAPNSTLQIYLDGNFVRQITVNGTSMMKPTPNFVVGAGTNTNSTTNVTTYSWSTKGFEGAIDEMYLYNRVLSANEVSDLFNLRVTPSSTVSNEKLIAHYDFENTSNNAHANTHHLTATMPASNMAAPAFVTGGKVGNAVRFNGSNALWNQTEFGPSWAGNDKNLTISTWVRHGNNNTTLYFTMFEMFESLFLRTNVSLGISRASGVFNATGGGVTIPANTWTHVTAQYDQQLSEVRLYINGDLRGTLTSITGFHAYNASFIVGAGTNSAVPNYSQKGFIGDIDEMYVFNRILTPAEIYGMANLAPVVSPVVSYPVTFSASAGGTLTATVDGVAISSGDMVEEGKTITFTATPDAGMQIGGWYNNGALIIFRGGVPTVHSLIHGEPGTNRTVTFAPAAYTVDFDTQNPAGTISATVDGNAISSGSTVGHLTRVIVTAAPATGYFLSHWIINGVTHVSEGLVPLTQNVQITQNTTFVAVFERDPAYAQVNFSVVGGNGTLTAKYQIMPSMGAAPAMKAKAVNPFVIIQSGDMVPKTSINNVYVTFEAAPDQGYAVGTWTENGIVYTTESPATYGMNVYNDINVTVSFVVAETSVRNTRFETLGLYPNPARDMVRLAAESNIDKVEVYTLSGALMQTEKGFGTRNINIQLGNLNEGLYLVKTYTDEGLQTAKLQVKR
jgi:hypothetical protein